MPRAINRKCLACAALSAEDAIATHGPQGDNCWNPGNENGWGYDCHRRRSHYRHRSDTNAVRRRLRRAGELPSASVQPTGTALEVAAPLPVASTAAVLVLYRQHAQAPVHAVAAEIWQGNQKLAQIQAVHCLGMRADRLGAYLKELLTSIHEQFGVARFEDVVKELPVLHCPIVPCPLKE